MKKTILFHCIFSCIAGLILGNVAHSGDMSNSDIPVFGPIMGQSIILDRPASGQYGSLFDYRIKKLINRESTLSQSIEGGVTLEVSESHRINACFAVHSEFNSAESKYISQDGKDYAYSRDDYFLMGASGDWVANDNETISIILTESWRKSCLAKDTSDLDDIHIELNCVTLAKIDRFPVNVLACKLLQNHSVLDKLTINLEDTTYAGPMSFQSFSKGRKKTIKGVPWILLGVTPGLKIISNEDRRKRPEILFMKNPVNIDEKKFLKPFHEYNKSYYPGIK